MNQEDDLMRAQITSMDFWDNDIDEIWNDWNLSLLEIGMIGTEKNEHRC